MPHTACRSLPGHHSWVRAWPSTRHLRAARANAVPQHWLDVEREAEEHMLPSMLQPGKKGNIQNAREKLREKEIEKRRDVYIHIYIYILTGQQRYQDGQGGKLEDTYIRAALA